MVITGERAYTPMTAREKKRLAELQARTGRQVRNVILRLSGDRQTEGRIISGLEMVVQTPEGREIRAAVDVGTRGDIVTELEQEIQPALGRLIEKVVNELKASRLRRQAATQPDQQ